MIATKRDAIESGTYSPSFKLSLARKDLRLVREAATEAQLDLKVAPAALDWLDQSAAAGRGDLDFSSVIATITAGVGTP